MPNQETECNQQLDELYREIRNFEAIAAHLIPSPGDIPELDGIDIYGKTIPLNGLVGGDHIIYLDFKKRFNLDRRIEKARSEGLEEVARNLAGLRRKAGIAISDVSGHLITDGLLGLMLHQAFLLGARYELDFFGELGTRLFENLNARFFRSSAVHKYLTLLYGEISNDGNFRFISAAHPPPVVFSRENDQIVEISPDLLTTYPPIGMLPSIEDIDYQLEESVLPFKDQYTVNEISLMGSGDILLLYTDGLSEHSDGKNEYFPHRMELQLRRVKDLSAREIFDAIENDAKSFSPLQDDLSFVIIKRL